MVLSSKFRASLVPAAAVIPAELEMGNIVAVKTYVVIFVFVFGSMNQADEHAILIRSR